MHDYDNLTREELIALALTQLEALADDERQIAAMETESAQLSAKIDLLLSQADSLYANRGRAGSQHPTGLDTGAWMNEPGRVRPRPVQRRLG